MYQAAVSRAYPEPQSDSSITYLCQFLRMFQAAVSRGILGLKAILALFSFSNSNICSKLLFSECILSDIVILTLFSSFNSNVCTKLLFAEVCWVSKRFWHYFPFQIVRSCYFLNVSWVTMKFWRYFFSSNSNVCTKLLFS